MITMIGLAVGIDYALFVVERYREERRRGAPEAGRDRDRRQHRQPGRPLLRADRRSSPWPGCFIVPNNIYRSLSIGAILVVLVAVLATPDPDPGGDQPARRQARLAAQAASYDAEADAAKQAAYDHETIHAGFWGRSPGS